MGTLNRRPILCSHRVYERFREFAEAQSRRGIAIGRHVIMPEHIHLFVRVGDCSKLGATIGFLKKTLSATLKQEGVSAPHWQPGFFDHILRSPSSYAEKWEYVFQNPVRAGLIDDAGKWPYSGEIVPIEF